MNRLPISLFVLATLLLLVPIAEANSIVDVGNGFLRNGPVGDAVTPLPGGFFGYEFTVENISVAAVPGQEGEPGFSPTPPFLIDWELPWFDDMGVSGIASPTGWAFSIEEVGTPNAATGWDGVAGWQDPSSDLYAGPNHPFTTGTKVLHWYATDFALAVSTSFIPIGGSLGGFEFIAPFDAIPAPYQSSWKDLPIQVGDPAFPGGVLPASPTLQGNAVPLPGTLLLGAIGLALCAGGRYLKRRQI